MMIADLYHPLKIALISYHKNVHALYPQEWINRHRRSVINQTYKDFHIWEINYGGGTERIFENSFYLSMELPTFVHAMNYMLEKLFNLGYDAVGNLNCDDWYALNRLEVQLPYIVGGYDLVSSNFALIRNGRETLRHSFHNLDIARELNRGHNIIAHPAVIYSRNFLETMRYDPEEVPREDMFLWKRALMMGHRIKIVEECLLFHTIHENSVCNSSNR